MAYIRGVSTSARKALTLAAKAQYALHHLQHSESECIGKSLPGEQGLRGILSHLLNDGEFIEVEAFYVPKFECGRSQQGLLRANTFKYPEARVFAPSKPWE
jgi:hypothetical protein